MNKKNKNYDMFLVKGSSMLPIIKPNQVVKIVKNKDVKVGDIVVFKGKSKGIKCRLIIHRVIKKDRNKITTKGDNQHICDFPVAYKEILGKVIKVGNKRVDTPYCNFINPVIAKISYLQTKVLISPKSRIVPKYLQDLKVKSIGDKDLHIEKTILFLLNFPYKINYAIFKLLKN